MNETWRSFSSTVVLSLRPYASTSSHWAGHFRGLSCGNMRRVGGDCSQYHKKGATKMPNSADSHARHPLQSPCLCPSHKQWVTTCHSREVGPPKCQEFSLQAGTLAYESLNPTKDLRHETCCFSYTSAQPSKVTGKKENCLPQGRCGWGWQAELVRTVWQATTGWGKKKKTKLSFLFAAHILQPSGPIPVDG